MSRRTFVSLAFATIAMCGFVALPLSVSAAGLTVRPVTTNLDNLVGASNAQWRFDATTTAELATGDVIRFVFPPINNGQPFTLTGATATFIGTTLYSALGPSTTTGVGAGQIGSDQFVYGYVSSTLSDGTAFRTTLGGLTNATGQLSTFNTLMWNAQGGTPSDPMDPMSPFSGPAKFTLTGTSTMTRAGGALVSDENSAITPASYLAGASTSYTFSITATSSIPVGGHVVVNFPAEYSLQAITVNLSQTISDHTATTLASFSTSTGVDKRVTLVTAGEATNPGDVITVVIGGIQNPATAGVYRSFTVLTTKQNGGLLDGSFFGFEQSDYGGGRPAPSDTIHVGGTNTINVQALKQSGASTVALSGDELQQVKVAVGCPDKGFFVGEKWLNTSAVATFSHVLDGNYIAGAMPFSMGSSSFYESFLPPSQKSITAVGGQTVTSTIVFGVPDTDGIITIEGGVAGQVAFVNAFSSDFQSFSPLFTDHTFATEGFSASGTGYAKLKLRSGQNWGFTVEGGQYGSGGNFTTGGVAYWPPSIPSAYVASTTAGTAPTVSLGTHAFVAADQALNVNILKAGAGEAVNNACVGVKRSGGGMFMGSQGTICGPNSGTQYQFKVPLGAITIEVSRPGFGKPDEYPVAITSASTTKVISIASPTSYISVTVQDSSGNKINGAPVFAHGSNGFAQSMTNSAGTSTLYLPAGTYVVEGFAPALGPLTPQTVTLSGSTASVTFEINTGALKTISGRVTSGGTGVASVKIGARGTGSTSGGNGTETDGSGNFTLFVPAGTYEVGGWSQNTGGLPPQNVNVSSVNASGVNFDVAAQGTLRFIIQNSQNVSPLFAGAFSDSTGRGNGTDSWTATGTGKYADITLPAGTYQVHAGSPVTGELSSAGETVTVVAATTVTKTYNAAATAIVTISGTVTSTAGNVADANVWASRINGPGFYSTQTDSSGNYTLYVPDARTYRVGVKIMGYVAATGDVEVAVSGNTTRHFIVVAAGAPITGQVTAGGSALSSGWVSAKKTIGSNEVWTGGPTDANGNFQLDVDAGTWTVYAEGPCYYRSSGTDVAAGTSGVAIALTAISGCSAPVPQMNGVTPASGGQVAKEGLTLDIPANALGTGQTTVSVSVSTAPLVVSSANATPLKGSVQRITATDSTGASVTSLNSSVSLAISYDPTELPNGFSEANLQLGYFDTNTGQWESVASTVDTVNNIISAQVDHFTDYGPILPGVPDSPTGLTATAASVSQINLAWTAVPEATSYVVYRSATDSNFTTSIGTTSGVTYNDTGLSASTRYYYKVAGVNADGEGMNSSSVNAATNAAAAAAAAGTTGGSYSSGSRGASSATGYSTPASTPAPTPSGDAAPASGGTGTTGDSSTSGAPAPATSGSGGGVSDPTNVVSLVATLGVTRNTDAETAVTGQVVSDGKEFGLTVSEAAAAPITNYIVYGISPATIKLGQGERRAVIRDYMDTVKRTNVVWSDVDRIATGQIPVARNLDAERAQVAAVLPIFRKIYGHAPNFKDAKENLAWNTLMYRIRFPRDLVKEAEGIKGYRALYKKTPKSPLGWSIVRVYGYVK